MQGTLPWALLVYIIWHSLRVSFKSNLKKPYFERSLVIFTFEITPVLKMVVITRSDPYWRFWIRISRGLCLQITPVSMKLSYHIMVDMVPSSLLEESPYNLGLNVGVYARQMGTFFMPNYTVGKRPICQKQD